MTQNIPGKQVLARIPGCRKQQQYRSMIRRLNEVDIMAIRVVEFSNRVYKIRKIFA
jgi:hypothetical protein